MHEKHDKEEGGDGLTGAGPAVGIGVHNLGDILLDTLTFVFPGTDEVEVFARFRFVQIWINFIFL